MHLLNKRIRPGGGKPQSERLEAADALLQPAAQLRPSQPPAGLPHMLLGIHLDLGS